MSLFIIFSNSLSFAQVNVLVCGAPSTAEWNLDVQQKLQATNLFNSVEVFDIGIATPTLAYLQSFDAVLTYTDTDVLDGFTVGNLLAQYIDLGGGVVNATFANASVPIGGNFNTTPYQVVVPQGQTQDVMLTLGAVDPCSPITEGINSFNGGTSSYRSTSNNLTPGSQVIANWSDDFWLVATKENVGPLSARRADLNFYPPSSDARGDFWVSSTQGGLLMAQALLWVAGETSPGPDTPGAINGVTTICENITTTYEIAPVPNVTTYNWTVPAGVNILSGQGSTSITVSITSTNGDITVNAQNACGTSESSVLSVQTDVDYLTIDVSNVVDVSCAGEENGSIDITVNGGSGNFTYQWDDAVSSETEDITGVSAGTYQVVVTDDNGCNAQIDVNVTEPTQLAGSVTSDDIIDGNDGSITLNSSGGVAPYSFEWIGPNSFSSTDQNLSGLNTEGDYTVTITDNNGCQVDVSVTLNSQVGLIEDQSSSVSLYPNPNNGQFRIDFSEFKNEVHILIFDVQGRIVENQSVADSSETYIQTYLEPGIYTVQMDLDKRIIKSKVIVE
jgi:hypothetical protein